MDWLGVLNLDCKGGYKMLDISKFVTVDENGKAVIDSDAFKSAYDADLRKSLDTNSENTKKKLEAEIRKQLEEEAKMSAEEKLKAERDTFEAEKSKWVKDFAQKQAKVKMASAELSEEEISTYLELVSNDEDIAKIDKILEIRKKSNDELKKKWEEDLALKQPNPNNNDNSGASNSYGKQMAEKHQKASQGDPKVTAWE